jgi:pimeloyl-ACP methyl ester carboxylesterase
MIRSVLPLSLISANYITLIAAWGVKDPWIRPVYADMIQQIYPTCDRSDIDVGHCPHDEAPDRVNEAILDFVKKVY